MRTKPRRLIKVKEYGINYEQIKTCPNDYREIAAGSKFMLSTDENGFIITGNNYTYGDPIIILGDSFVECLFVQRHNVFVPSQSAFLEKNIKKNI